MQSAVKALEQLVAAKCARLAFPPAGSSWQPDYDGQHGPDPLPVTETVNKC